MPCIIFVMKKTISIMQSNPQLLKEWDYEKNGNIDANTVARGSIKKYWWVCSKGHHWEAMPLHRSRGSGCPFCSGRKPIKGVNDLKTVSPDLASEWHPTLNEGTLPDEVKPNSSRIVWWRCKNCGNEYESKISHRYRGSGCPYCASKKVDEGKNDLESQFPTLATEWHPTKNGTLLPSQVTTGSRRRVWWFCKKGHEWKTAVHNRTSRNQGCPFCSHSGQTSFPEQAVLFYLKKTHKNVISRYKIQNVEIDIFLPDNNIGVEYDGVFYHRNREKHDEEKNMLCKAQGIRLIRIREEGLKELDSSENIIRNDLSQLDSLNVCIESLLSLLGDDNTDVDVNRDEQDILDLYYSVKIDNSLGKSMPFLIEEWHPTLNNKLTPFDITANSERKVWWICKQCGNEWQTTPRHRHDGKGCPECAKKIRANRRNETLIKNGSPTLASIHPDIAEEWLYSKNFDLTPDKVTHQSNKKVWWRCKLCGHEWSATISSRSSGGGCPVCAEKKRKESLNKTLLSQKKSLKEQRPDIAIDWHPTKNDMTPEMVLPGSGKKVWWKCHLCGAEWEDTIAHRTSGRTCRRCKGKGIQ